MRPDEIFLGGCYRTTPDHIRHAAEEVAPLRPRVLPDLPVAPRLPAPESCEFTS